MFGARRKKAANASAVPMAVPAVKTQKTAAATVAIPIIELLS